MNPLALRFTSPRLLRILLLLFIVPSLSSCGYNSMVNAEEQVNASWGQVENAYQRRADLIPNLVSTVKGAANFEKSTLEAVINARASATQVTANIDPGSLTPENIQKFQAAQDGLSSAISRLLVTVERYPELKANQNFLNLQGQLEGTENRISVERGNFNTSVKTYNSLIRRFPNNIFSGLFGFEKKGYFESAPGSDKAPDVEFDFEDDGKSDS